MRAQRSVCGAQKVMIARHQGAVATVRRPRGQAVQREWDPACVDPLLDSLSLSLTIQKLEVPRDSGCLSPRCLAKATHRGFFIFWSALVSDRAIVFIDGNNFYHALKAIGVADLGRLDYAKISAKIAGPAREWRATR